VLLWQPAGKNQGIFLRGASNVGTVNFGSSIRVGASGVLKAELTSFAPKSGNPLPAKGEEITPRFGSNPDFAAVGRDSACGRATTDRISLMPLSELGTSVTLEAAVDGAKKELNWLRSIRWDSSCSGEVEDVFPSPNISEALVRVASGASALALG